MVEWCSGYHISFTAVLPGPGTEMVLGSIPSSSKLSAGGMEFRTLTCNSLLVFK